MKKYVCSVCGYVYDEEKGCPDQSVASGTKFEDLPDSFVCPMCGVEKDMFEEQ
jgi:rubredoxin